MDSHHTNNSNNGGGSGGPRSPNYYNNMNRTENHSSNNPSGPPSYGHGHGQGRGGQGGHDSHYDGQESHSYGHNTTPSQGQGQLNYRGHGQAPQPGGYEHGHGHGHPGQGGYGRQNHQHDGPGGGGGGGGISNNQDLNYDPRFYSSERRSPGGENEQSIEGILPSLKQLDINQIPPDILAYLLKSTRIDQLVANTSSAQQNQQQQQQQQHQQQQQRPGSGGPYVSRSSPPASMSMHNMPPSTGGPGSNQPQPLMRSPNTPNSGPYNNPNNEWNPGSGGPGQNQGRNSSGGGQGYGGNPNRGGPPHSQQQQQQRSSDSNQWSRDSVPSRNNAAQPHHHQQQQQQQQHSYNQQQQHQQSPRNNYGNKSSGGGGGGGPWTFSPGAKEFIPRSPHQQSAEPQQQYNPKYQNQPHHQLSYQQQHQKNAYLSRTMGHPSQTYGDHGGSGGGGDHLSWAAEMDSMRGPKFENYMLNQFDLQGGSASDFDTDVDCVLENVTDTINQLALNPADFHRASRRTVDVLKKYLNDVDTLGVIVTLIFEQSVSNANFCYSGAKLCQVFHKHEIAVGGVTFKNLLLQRCQEEFTNCLQSMGMDLEMEKRSPGLILFFAELYLNFFVEIAGKGVKNMLFGSAALELMTKLVSIQPVTGDNFKCVFRTLKLIGWDLDHETHSEIKRELDTLLKLLGSLREGTPAEVEPKVKEYVEVLFDLRNKNWNKGDDEDTSSASSGIADDQASCGSGGAGGAIQYYELPDTVDEDDDDYSNLLIDDEPEEVRRAYEEFLKMTANLN